jgi:hypothetical protein
MILQGQFNDIDDNLVTVQISKSDGVDTTVTIGENGLFFAGDPITIETDLENTFSTLIRKSCTINLLTKHYIGDALWAANANNIKVEISKENNVIFNGFVEPNTYSQPYVSLDEFSINCIDALSALQYYNYKDATPNTYDGLKLLSGTASFKTMLIGALTTALGNSNFNVYYDCSKATTQGREQTVFDDLGISESYIFGETYDDIWTCEDVVSEIMQYLNLHIIQQGNDFYVFDWNTLKSRRNIWYNIKTNTSAYLPNTKNVTITGEMHGADDTNITVSEVYNQISVTCDMESIDSVITSPLDNDSLTSPYTGKQLYMREYISEGNGTSAKNAFIDMVKENSADITYDDAKYIDWYIQFKNNPQWIMHTNNGTGNIMDVINNNTQTFNNGKYINQWKIAHTIHWNRLWPAIISMGSVERKARIKDDSPTAKVSMTDYLFIPVNGNEVDDNTNSVPTPTELESHAPIIEYLGGNGGVYSPSDDNTINYLVFSGSMLLQPITQESKTNADATGFTAMKQAVNNNQYISTVPSDNNDKGRFYTRKFFTTVNPSDEPDETTWLNDMSLQPWTSDKANHLFEYKYAEDWGTQDLISKLPVLECELIIGNKRLIETDMDEYGNSTFQWVTLGEEPQETYEGETYTITTFTLGVNPKIDDFIIGTDFKLQNTVSIPMNIDTEGTAIPIKRSDSLSGAIQFRILGPVNTTWNQITRRHPTWFRHTKWTTENKIILAHIESIIIKDFKCQIYSNNALNETDGNDELIYVSDETDRYVNKNDDTEFKFITQPTADVILAQGLEAGVNINAVVDLNNDTPLQSIYNATTNETAKAEEHFVNQYYGEYSVPRLVMEMTVHNSSDISWRNNYRSTPLNKSFYVIATSDDVRNNTTTIKLKQK